MDPKESADNMKLLGKQTFVVNTNNPLIKMIQKLDSVDPALTQDMVNQAYELSLLSQREMDPVTLNDFISRSNRVLEKLVEMICQQNKEEK